MRVLHAMIKTCQHAR